MDLFTLDENKMPVIHPGTLSIDCFKKLWRRVVKIDGDFNGAKKEYNLRELGYIYFMGRYDSRFRLLPQDEKEAKVRKLVKLPDDYKPDALALECIDVLVDSQVTASSELVLSLEGTVQALSKYLKTAQAQIATGNLTTVDTKDVKDIIAIIKDAPDLISEIAKAKTALHKEQESLMTGRKGRTINKFELT